MRIQDDTGLSEVLDTTLIVALALVLAGITAAFVFGVFVPVDKTAYLVPKFRLVNESGQTMISVYNRGGEPVSFTNGSSAKYRADLYMDTQSGSFRAHPAPDLGVFEPGDTIYVYYSGSDYVITKSISDVTFPPLPAGRLMITLVDATSGVVMAQEVLTPGSDTPTMTLTTATPATTVTTATPATTVTTATPATTVTTATPVTTVTTATPVTTVTTATPVTTVTTAITKTTRTTATPTTTPVTCVFGRKPNGTCECPGWARWLGLC